MFELLLVVIGVLALLMLLLIGRSRRSSGDPASSVQDFNRALTAMEPGGRTAPTTSPQAEPEAAVEDERSDDDAVDHDRSSH